MGRLWSEARRHSDVRLLRAEEDYAACRHRGEDRGRLGVYHRGEYQPGQQRQRRRGHAA